MSYEKTTIMAALNRIPMSSPDLTDAELAAVHRETPSRASRFPPARVQ